MSTDETTSRPRSRIGRRIGSAAVILAAVAGVVLVRGGSHQATSPVAAPSPRPGVVLLGFASRCDSAASRWVSVALAERVRSELSAGRGIRVASGESVAQLRADLGIAEAERYDASALARIRSRMGADLVLSGACDCGPDGSIGLTVVGQDPATGAVRLDQRETVYESRLGTVARSVATEVRRVVLGSGEAPLSADSRDRGGDAERLRAEGLSRLRASDAQGARGYLESAVATDPHNPAAQAALGQAWSMLGYQVRAAEAARRAFEASAALPPEEKLVVQARWLEVSGRHADAAAAWRSLSEQFPDDVEHPLRLARELVAAGQGREALGAIELARGIPGAAGDPRLDLEQARAHDQMGQFDDALRVAERAAASGEARGARLLVAEARLVQAEALRKRGRTAEAADICADAARRFGAAGDRAGRARALGALATNLWYRGDHEGARRAAEEAVVVSRDLGDNSGVLRALNTLAGLASDQGRLDAARRQYEQVLAIATEVGESDRELMAITNIGIALWKQGDLVRARQALGEALSQARARHNDRRTAFALLSLGEVAVDGGEVEQARGLNEEALAIGQRLGVAGIQADAAYGLGRTLLTRGDTAGARARLEEAVTSWRERSLGNYLAQGNLALGRVALEEGRADEAGARADEAAAAFRAQRATPYEGAALVLKAAACRTGGRVAEARTHLDRAQDLLAGSEFAALRVMLTIEDGALEAASGRAGSAQARLLRAVADARRSGLVTLQTAAELALAEAGDQATRGRRLRAVEEQATRSGLDGVARRARALQAVESRR